jgi:hypothetical protein
MEKAIRALTFIVLACVMMFSCGCGKTGGGDHSPVDASLVRIFEVYPQQHYYESGYEFSGARIWAVYADYSVKDVSYLVTWDHRPLTSADQFIEVLFTEGGVTKTCQVELLVLDYFWPDDIISVVIEGPSGMDAGFEATIESVQLSVDIEHWRAPDKTVVWTIVFGAEYADLTPGGLFTPHVIERHSCQTVRVRATAVNGVYGEKDIILHNTLEDNLIIEG